MWLKFLWAILINGIIFICYYFGQRVPITAQIPLFEGLRNTSAIIFGVMGAWIAILHQDSLKKLFSRSGGNIPKEDRETINLLLSPILISTLILAIVLVAPLMISIGKTIPSLAVFKNIFRGISFSVLSALTLLQLWTLVLTLIPSDILKRTVQKQEEKDKIKYKMFSKTKQKE